MKKLYEKLFGFILAIAILLGTGNAPEPNPLLPNSSDTTVNSSSDDNPAEIDMQIDGPDQEISQ